MGHSRYAIVGTNIFWFRHNVAEDILGAKRKTLLQYSRIVSPWKEAVMNKISAFIVGASVGCAFGVLAALALAPQSGAETRGMVAQGAGAFAEDAQDFGAGFGYIAQGGVRNVRQKGEEAIKGIRKPAEEIAADELEAKPAEESEELAADEA